MYIKALKHIKISYFQYSSDDDVDVEDDDEDWQDVGDETRDITVTMDGSHVTPSGFSTDAQVCSFNYFDREKAIVHAFTKISAVNSQRIFLI